MYKKGKAAQSMRGRGGGRGNGTVNYSHSTTSAPQAQGGGAPSGDLPAYLKGNVIYVAGRHLASVERGELRRTFDASRELYRGGLCFRCDVLDAAQNAGAAAIVAKDRHTGKAWRVDLATFRARGFRFAHKRFGAQIGLALSDWQVINGNGGTSEPEQLSLFGGGR